MPSAKDAPSAGRGRRRIAPLCKPPEPLLPSSFSPGCSTVAVLGRKRALRGFSVLGVFRLSVGNSEARPAGLEPATCGLEVRCSVQLSYGRIGLGMRIAPRQGPAKIPDGSNAAAVRSSEWLLDVSETLAMPGIVAYAWRRSWVVRQKPRPVSNRPRAYDGSRHLAGSRPPPRPKVRRRGSLGPCRSPSPPEGSPAPRFPPLLL